MSFIVDKPFRDVDDTSYFVRPLSDGRFLYSQFARGPKYHHVKPKEKRMICVLADGKHDYDEYSAESHARYAARISVGLHVMRDYTNYNGMIHWEKHRIRHWLNQGYRVLYLDNDTMVLPTCPNLFDLVPPEYIGMLDQAAHYFKDTAVDDKWYVLKMAELLGTPFDDEYMKKAPYYQAGVFVVSPRHSFMFTLPKNPQLRRHISDWPLADQSWMNYHIMKRGLKVLSMPREFNCMRPVPGEIPWIVHAAGVNEKDRRAFMSTWST